MSRQRPTRAEYRWFLEIPTRWMDNDVYRHVNNVRDGVTYSNALFLKGHTHD